MGRASLKPKTGDRWVRVDAVGLHLIHRFERESTELIQVPFENISMERVKEQIDEIERCYGHRTAALVADTLSRVAISKDLIGGDDEHSTTDER